MTADEEEDYGALIYRESQLRKAEAAAAAAVARDAKASSSTRRRATSTRVTSTAVQSKSVLNKLQKKRTSKRKLESTEAETVAEKATSIAIAVRNKPTVKAVQKKRNPERKRKLSTEVEGVASKKGGTSGKRRRYECFSDGCTNYAIKGGVCIKHGATREHKRWMHKSNQTRRSVH
jgi:hypothetical protein